MPRFGRSPWLIPALCLFLLFATGPALAGPPFSGVAALNSNATTDSGLDQNAQITTDEKGNWVAAWFSEDTLGSTIGFDRDILVSRSSNNGAAWTSPAALNTNATTDSGADDNPHVTTDGAGNWLAVWQSTDTLGGTIGADRDIFVSRSTNNGLTWTAPAALNTNAATDSGGDLNPHITSDGAGNWVAVWFTDDSLGSTIGFDYDILVSRSSDNGATWTSPAALNTNATTDSGDDSNPKVTTDGDGHWLAVWHSDDTLGSTVGFDFDIFTALSLDEGATWTSPVALNTNATTDSGGDFLPRVAMIAGGNWVTVWYSSDTLGGTIGTDIDILVSRTANYGGTWTAPAALNTNAGTDGTASDLVPQIETDGVGNWIAVWYSDTTLGGTIGADFDILMSRSTDNGATWNTLTALNDNATTDSGADSRPQIKSDGAGNWISVWDSVDTLGGTIGSDADILVSTSGPDTDGDGLADSVEAFFGTNTALDDTDSDGLLDGFEVRYGFNPLVGGEQGQDPDGDGLTNLQEQAAGTNPNLVDTDGDGLCDGSTTVGACVGNEGTYGTNPLLFDTDGDGLSDGDEVAVHGTNPLLSDTDGDGLSDSAEITGGTNPSSVDTDGDGLCDGSTTVGGCTGNEVAAGTNPLLADTDGDGLNDGQEVTAGTNPLVADTDGDGLSDGDEVNIHSSNPLVTDTDGDGLDDGVEVNTHGTSPILADTDGDGARDPDELSIYGTLPTVAASRPIFSGVAALNTNAGADSGTDFLPQVTADGAGNWVAVWESDDTLGGTLGADNDILVARSTNNGTTWTAPAALNTNAASDSGSDVTAQVTTDGAGNWVATWSSDDALGGTIGTDTDILVARSTDNGATWTAPAVLNSNAATDSGSDVSPQVTTDGAGNWVTVWESTDTLGGTIGTDTDILVARSTDNGATWTAPVALKTTAGTDGSFPDQRPRLSADGLGNWVSVWESNDSLGGTIGTDGDIFVARSTDNGATWTAPAALNSNAATDSGSDFSAQLTTDGAGNWVAAWRSTDTLGATIGTDDDILVARSTDNGATWTAPAALNSNASTDSGSDREPDVMADGVGGWVAVWSSNDSLGGTISSDFDILVSHSTDNGATWTAPLPMNTNAVTDGVAGDFSIALASDGGSNWIGVWASDGDLGGTIGFDVDILVSSSGPDTDGDGLADGTERLHGSNPTLLDTDGDGLNDGDEVLIHGSSPTLTDTDGDGLTDGNEVNTHGTNPTLADTDGDGLSDGDEVNTHGTNPLLTDSDGDGLSDGDEVNTHGTNPLLTDSDGDSVRDGEEISIYGTSPTVLASRPLFAGVAALNTNAGTDSEGDFDAQMAADGLGNWVSVWQSNDSLSGTIGTDSDILVTRSSDDGATWTAPVALNTNAGTDAGSSDLTPQVTTDGGGNWVAVWGSGNDLGGTIGNDFDILVARSTDNGATWTAPAALNTNAGTDAGFDDEPQVTTDGAGNWVAVWRSNDTLGGAIGTDLDILVARSSDNGATWTAPAALNANAAVDGFIDEDPEVATDGAGNWVAVWESEDSLGFTIGFDVDILVARSTDNGATWTAPAALNSNAATDSGGDFEPQVTADGAGNWVAVWWSNDDLGGTIGTDEDVLVARSTDNGASWTTPVALNTNAATDSGADINPQVTTDGAGGWVAAWESNDDLGGAIGTDFDPLTARSTNNGATWTAPVPLNTNAGTDGASLDFSPEVATDGAGHWVAAWFSNNTLGGTVGTDYDLHFSTSGPDTDGDGLSDGAENLAGSNPLVTDTDGDGLTDGFEIANGLSPIAIDTDGDGLCDGNITVGACTGNEAAAGTNPTLADTDSDGLNDGDEVNIHGTNPLLTDTDGDGLTDGAEVNTHGTNPLLTDTDGDGLTDGDEVNLHGTNPTLADTDGDGLSDGDEINIHGTNPLLADTDGDGYSDGDEVNLHGTDPLDPESAPFVPALSLPGVGLFLLLLLGGLGRRRRRR